MNSSEYDDECIGIADWERKEIWEDEYEESYQELKEEMKELEEEIQDLEEELEEL